MDKLFTEDPGYDYCRLDREEPLANFRSMEIRSSVQLVNMDTRKGIVHCVKS